jgi:hypothetical protein
MVKDQPLTACPPFIRDQLPSVLNVINTLEYVQMRALRAIAAWFVIIVQ